MSGEPSIRPQSAHTLYALARAARQCPGRLRIEGHTDNTADPTLGVRLSRLRATAVKQALVERGIDSARLLVSGLGPHAPVASNRTRDGRAANRRIEVRVVRPHERQSE